MAIMKLNYQTLLEALYTVIANGGANLNTNLSKSVEQIIYGDPLKRVVEINRYPTICIHLVNKTEEWATVGYIDAGDAGIREAIVTIQVYAIVKSTEGSDASDKEARYLASNIEGLIRNNVRLTNYTNLFWIEPKETQFAGEFRNGTHISSATIIFECKLQITN